MASSRRAHQVLGIRMPSVGERAATSPHIQTSVKSIKLKRRGRHLLKCGLPPQEGATSPRGAHLLNSNVLISLEICNQSIANQLYLVPFDSFLTFAI
jgi:hypothetical protein